MHQPQIEIPNHLKGKVNHVNDRVLNFSPSVLRGDHNEYNSSDFELVNYKIIGEGGFSKVYKVKHRNSQKVYATKVITKYKIAQKKLYKQIQLEVDIQYQLDHPNIIKLYDHYEDETNIYLILEFCSGGQLYEEILDSSIDEEQAAKYMKQLIQALKYLHLDKN